MDCHYVIRARTKRASNSDIDALYNAIQKHLGDAAEAHLEIENDTDYVNLYRENGALSFLFHRTENYKYLRKPKPVSEIQKNVIADKAKQVITVMSQRGCAVTLTIEVTPAADINRTADMYTICVSKTEAICLDGVEPNADYTHIAPSLRQPDNTTPSNPKPPITLPGGRRVAPVNRPKKHGKSKN